MVIKLRILMDHIEIIKTHIKIINLVFSQILKLGIVINHLPNDSILNYVINNLKRYFITVFWHFYVLTILKLGKYYIYKIIHVILKTKPTVYLMGLVNVTPILTPSENEDIVIVTQSIKQYKNNSNK
jgi:hypothetical protein